MGWNYLPIPKLQRLHRWSLRMDNQFHPIICNGWNYLSILDTLFNGLSSVLERFVVTMHESACETGTYCSQKPEYTVTTKIRQIGYNQDNNIICFHLPPWITAFYTQKANIVLEANAVSRVPPRARDAIPDTFNIGVFKCGKQFCHNKHIYNEFENWIDSCYFDFDSNNWRNLP